MTVFASCFGAFLVLLAVQAASAESASSVSPKELPGVSNASKPEISADPLAPRAGLNQFVGTIQSVDADARVFRMIVEGGYNVELTYTTKTACIEGGKALSVESLDYNDKVVVRYAGRELAAVQIERLSKNIRFPSRPVEASSDPAASSTDTAAVPSVDPSSSTASSSAAPDAPPAL